jgi:hypothetical protein
MRNPMLLLLLALALLVALIACAEDTTRPAPPGGNDDPGDDPGNDPGDDPGDDPDPPDAITLTPTDDATIDFAAADQNFGLAPILRVEVQAVALLRFDLTAVPDTLAITGASLHVTQTADQPQVAGALLVQAVPADQWQEDSITWQTAPTEPGEWLGTVELGPLPAGDRELAFADPALHGTVVAEHTGDGILTLRLASPERLAMHARHATAASTRPRLELDLAPRTR